MNNFKLSKKAKMALAIGIILFVTYNIVVFTWAGISGHSISFWMSYAFMNVSFFTMAISGILLLKRDIEPKDWIWGYPIIRHCTLYIIIQFVLSLVFMIWDKYDCPKALALSVQLIVMAVFFVLIISCFITKETIEDIRQNVKTGNSFVNTALLDVNKIQSRLIDDKVKTEFFKLAEKIRYSDPVSNEQLTELEQRIHNVLDVALVNINQSNMDGALNCCKEAGILLEERNQKCKMFK